MSTCIKTGATVYVENYGEYIHTDLMKTDSVYHFYIMSEDHRMRATGKPIKVNLVVYQGDIDILKTGRDFVVSSRQCSGFDYDGFQHEVV